MDTSQIQTLTDTFEGHAQQTESGVEYWLARDLQQLLGYAKWENFQMVVAKARTACEVAGHLPEDHFREVTKMIKNGTQGYIRGEKNRTIHQKTLQKQQHGYLCTQANDNNT